MGFTEFVFTSVFASAKGLHLNTLPIPFSIILTFYLFVFFLGVVPYFLRNQQRWTCVAVTMSTAFVLAIVSVSDFDIQERFTKGLLFGAAAMTLGWLIEYFRKRLRG